MRVYSYEKGAAAELIDAGMKYAAQNNATEVLPEVRNIASGISAALGFTTSTFGLITSSMSLRQSDPSKRQIKLNIKNDALVIIVPVKVSVSTNTVFYGKTFDLILPGETSSLYLESNYNATYEFYDLAFAVISIDENFIPDAGSPVRQDVCLFNARITNNSSTNKLELFSIQTQSMDTDKHPDDPSKNGTSFFSFEGFINSSEPSFGLCHFNTPAVTRLGQVGESCLKFTASDRRSEHYSASFSPTHVERDAIEFLRDLILSKRATSETRIFITTITLLSAMLGIAAAGIGFASAIRDQERQKVTSDNVQLLSINIKNLSKYTLYVIETYNCNSCVRNEGIAAEGGSITIPLTIGTQLRVEPEIYIRLVTGDGRPNLDIFVKLRDYHPALGILKVSQVTYFYDGERCIIPDRASETSSDSTEIMTYRTPDSFSKITANLLTMGVTHGGSQPEINLAIVTID